MGSHVSPDKTAATLAALTNSVNVTADDLFVVSQGFWLHAQKYRLLDLNNLTSFCHAARFDLPKVNYGVADAVVSQKYCLVCTKNLSDKSRQDFLSAAVPHNWSNIAPSY